VIAPRLGLQDAPLKFCRLRSFSRRGKGFGSGIIPCCRVSGPTRGRRSLG
jgi:hypothetical protein